MAACQEAVENGAEFEIEGQEPPPPDSDLASFAEISFYCHEDAFAFIGWEYSSKFVMIARCLDGLCTQNTRPGFMYEMRDETFEANEEMGMMEESEEEEGSGVDATN